MTTPQPVNPEELEKKYRHPGKGFELQEITRKLWNIYFKGKLVYRLHIDVEAETMRLEKVKK